MKRRAVMAKQALKLAARSKVREALNARQKERVERERRHGEWAVDLLSALAERDEVIEQTERAAGDAVVSLIGDGLSVSEIVSLCGDEVDAREISRLAKIPAGSTAG